MSTVAQTCIEGPPLLLHVRPAIEMTDEQFFAFCQVNRDLRIERTAEGDVLIMSPTGGKSSERNAELAAQLRIWARRARAGSVFDSSGGFVLPTGAIRSPDAAWVKRDRMAILSQAQREKFLPLCPDFVVELLSPSDDLATVRAKMEEYMANGAQLGWLIDPARRAVEVYRRGGAVERLENPATVSGDPVLPGFQLDLAEIWEPGL
jgi:Uma2 family endonuclease